MNPLAPSRIGMFLRWLFPSNYAEVAKCNQCGETKCKNRMVHYSYNWFCNEECQLEFWKDSQW